MALGSSWHWNVASDGLFDRLGLWDRSLSEEEIEVRRAEEYSRGTAAFKPQRQRPIPQSLRAYALFAASADKGAVRIVPENI